jgi:hypothetical protein
VPWKRRSEVAVYLKRTNACVTAEAAAQRLGEFEAKRDKEYLPIGSRGDAIGRA